MPKRPGRDMMVGSVFAFAMLILALAIMSVGGESELWTPTVGYGAIFPNTDGLRVGSPVKLAGVRVGWVRGVQLPTDPDAPGIEVRMLVRQEYAGRVREDSKARLRYLQLLSGEKFVEITPGNPELPAVSPGAVVPVLEETEILEQGEDIAANLIEITVALSDILEPLRKGEGLLGELIHDPEFGKEGLSHLRGALENLNDLTGRIRQGRGFVGRALYDAEFESTLDDLARAIGNLASFTERLDQNRGALGALMSEDGAGREMVEDLRDVAASLRQTSANLESRQGLVGRLLNDTEYSEALAADLREVVRNAAEISRKINAGEGTLGALVNERVLHDQAEHVVAGVDDSKFARWLVKHYRKKGIELDAEEVEKYLKDQE